MSLDPNEQERRQEQFPSLDFLDLVVLHVLCVGAVRVVEVVGVGLVEARAVVAEAEGVVEVGHVEGLESKWETVLELCKSIFESLYFVEKANYS